MRVATALRGVWHELRSSRQERQIEDGPRIAPDSIWHRAIPLVGRVFGFQCLRGFEICCSVSLDHLQFESFVAARPAAIVFFVKQPPLPCLRALP